MSVSKNWLPVGQHYGLTISHRDLSARSPGPMSEGGAKIIWHTTEGGSVESVINTLVGKSAAVHFVIDPKSGVVVQLLPLDHAGAGLQHIFEPETNKANAIQVEIVGFAGLSKLFNYTNLAALAVLIEHRVGVPRSMPKAARSFMRPRKLTPWAFVRAAGHLGHVHVPGNDHTDPGRLFNGALLRRRMRKFDSTPPK